MIMRLNTLRPKKCRHYTDDILNENLEFRLTFHLILFLMVKLTIFQQWLRKWLGANQATSHYMDRYWLLLLTCVCVTWLQWVEIDLFNKANYSHFWLAPHMYIYTRRYGCRFVYSFHYLCPYKEKCLTCLTKIATKETIWNFTSFLY